MVLATLSIRSPESRTSEMLQSLRVLMRPARAEKGFISCQLCVDADDPNFVVYEERWRTREDLQEQLCSSRYTRLLALMESAAEQPSLEFLFVTEKKGLEYVAAAREES